MPKLYKQPNARFFISASDLSALKGFAAKGWPLKSVQVHICLDFTLPEREPEAFQGKYEIKILKVE